MNLPFAISFLYPAFLWLLLLGLIFFVLGRPSRHQPGRRRQWLALSLRLLILLLLVLGLAGARFDRSIDRVTTVFVLDVSDSVTVAERARAESFLRAALAEMPEKDQAGVILFGREALVEQLPGPARAIPALNSIPAGNATNIEDALRLALALFPDGAARRIVLLSDGRQTIGDARRLAELAAAHQVDLSVYPLGDMATDTAPPEILVAQVSAPTHARQHQQIGVEVSVYAARSSEATLRLLIDGAPVESKPVRLTRGQNHFRFEPTMTQPGFRRFRVELTPLDPAADSRLQNNWGGAFTTVFGPPTVLVVEGQPGEGAALLAALAATGLQASAVSPTTLPDTLPDLAAYEALVLANVPASALSEETQERLAAYVRDLGRGLVMLGGPQSFGAGGYLRSPLEAALPVEMDVRNRSREPNVALVLAVDKSGSMGACHCDDPDLRQQYERVQSGLPKIDIAKEAIFQAATVLGDLDYLGVVSFADRASWEVALSPRPGEVELEGRIGGMLASGQTNIFAGLAAAEAGLVAAPARIKHVILLTDGWSTAGAYDEIIARFAKEGITLSVVAAGGGSAEYLAALAERGGGKYYPAATMGDVPQIFLKETIRTVGEYIIEEPFRPVVSVSGGAGGGDPILRGVSLQAVPPLLGYNGATPKQTAQVAMLTPRGDPLLASWQYGLGRSVAWTSDLSGRWAQEWLSWEAFAPFVAQLVGWTLPLPGDDALTVTAAVEGEAATLTVDTLDADGRPLDADGATVEAVTTRLLTPDGRTETVTLEPVGAGRYQAELPLTGEGVYLTQVIAYGSSGPDGAAEPMASQTGGLVLPYSAEYATMDANPALLANLAEATGGRMLTEPGQAFEHNLPLGRRTDPLWPFVLLLAAFLFPLDVAVRRLRLDRQAGSRAWVWLAARVSGLIRPAMSAETTQGASPSLRAFRRVRERMRRPADTADSPVTSPVAAPPAGEPSSTEDELLAPERGDDATDTLSRLRQAKQRARRQGQ